MGPGPARNRGITTSSRRYVVLLDDDDELAPGALHTIAGAIRSFPNHAQYPVFQFGHGNAVLADPFRVIRLDDYLSGVLKGDFLPVVDRERFQAMGFAYPDVRVGAEHLLWWEIADKVGIPTWAEKVCVLHADAPIRLTDPRNQIARAKEYAEMQELTLDRFGEVLAARFPAEYRTRRLGAATYWMLAGDRRRAREHLADLSKDGGGALVLALRALSYAPRPVVRWAFRMYRRSTG